MPFTLSHPAAVIPFCKAASHPIFLLAMIVGSISPDFGYYLRMFSLATFSHTIMGSVLVCIPAGLLMLACIFATRRAILWLVPSRLRLILDKVLQIPSKNKTMFVLQVSFWIWVGSLTHVLWDSFTHKTGWFVVHFHALQTTFALRDGLEFPVYYILQQASTLIGLLIVTFFAFRMLREVSPCEEDRKGDSLRYLFWGALIVASLLIAAPFAMSHSSAHAGLLAFRTFVFQLGIISGAVFGCFSIASIVFAVCTKK
jgi:hypothetical protein